MPYDGLIMVFVSSIASLCHVFIVYHDIVSCGVRGICHLGIEFWYGITIEQGFVKFINHK